jgi:prophage regulatory protein
MNQKRTLVAAGARRTENRQEKPRDIAEPRPQRTQEVHRLESVPLRFLRFSAVRDRTGLSRSTIWRLERRGMFPKHRRISTNAVAWLEQEINEWLLARIEA